MQSRELAGTRLYGGIMGKSEIVYFAQNILGCGCDNSVFNSIDVTGQCDLDCGIRLRKKIVIGNRLLIYIADADEVKPGDIRKVIQYVETNCTNTYKTEEIYYGFNDYVKTVLTSKNKAQVNKMDDIVTTFGFKPEYNPAKGIVTKEMLMWLEENVQRSGKELPYNLELISSMNQLVFKTKEEYIRKAFINMVKPLEGNGWLSFPTQYRKGNGNYCGHANVIPIPDDKYMCLSCLCILQDKKPKETPIDKNFANGLLEFTKEIKLGKVEKKPKGLTSFGDF